MSSLAAAIVALHLAPARAAERRVTLSTDQQIVVAAAIDDTFPRPRNLKAPIALCLDVRSADDPLDEAPPVPRRGAQGKKTRALDAGLAVIQGAPPELVARVFRPWRPVVSASSCHLDARQPFTLDDTRTPARLVTVRVSRAAVGALRIDWTGGTTEPQGGLQSRDCTASHGSRGWIVRCGGTWSE
jgi:hypothetical protein